MRAEWLLGYAVGLRGLLAFDKSPGCPVSPCLPTGSGKACEPGNRIEGRLTATKTNGSAAVPQRALHMLQYRDLTPVRWYWKPHQRTGHRMGEPEHKARIAAGNNADLCAAVMTAHSVWFERDAGGFLCLDPPPAYFPGLVSLDPNAAGALLSRIAEADSVKDSFACLDAEVLGLRVLFEASWIWCQTEWHAMPRNWSRITCATELSEWQRAWRGDDAAEEADVFPSACLDDPNLAILARRSGQHIQAGCIANLSEAAVGMSNVFSLSPEDPLLFDEALSAVSARGQGRPVVGYEDGAALDAARRAGFQVVGPLRVLIRAAG